MFITAPRILLEYLVKAGVGKAVNLLLKHFWRYSGCKEVEAMAGQRCWVSSPGGQVAKLSKALHAGDL